MDVYYFNAIIMTPIPSVISSNRIMLSVVGSIVGGLFALQSNLALKICIQ